MVVEPIVIGLTAGFFTTFAFLPQAIKTFKTRDTEGISLAMYVMFVTGVALWAIYGRIVRDMPIFVSNVIILFLASLVLIIKLKNNNKDKRKEGKA